MDHSLTLVIGGSGSGKSEFAENYLVSHSMGQRVYVATMQPYDEECLRRIERHRRMRAKKRFFTVECQDHLEELRLESIFQNIEKERNGSRLENKDCQQGNVYDILLECVSNLMANEMYGDHGRGGQAKDVIVGGICSLRRQAGQLVVVTNDIFSDGIQYDASTVEYMEQLGLLNQELAKMSDVVIEVVAGCPIFFKKR